MRKKEVQLSRLVNHSKPRAVFNAVKKIFLYYYPKNEFSIVRNDFKIVKDLFGGDFIGYRACNTEYHNLNHTMDAMLAAARLIDGYNLTVRVMDCRTVVRLLLAALFHDTGYIQEVWDTIGTGAKYTKTHVNRSIVFIEKNKQKLGLSEVDVQIIGRIISCTGVYVNWNELSFKTEEERIAGAMMGTADLLGQMADRLYLEKLLFLYYEFKEAGIPDYNTEYDIIRKTLDFYEITKKSFEGTLLKVYKYARAHFKERYKIDKNLYIEAIEKHIDYLRKIIADSSTNFRKKLKRRVGQA